MYIKHNEANYNCYATGRKVIKFASLRVWGFIELHNQNLTQYMQE